MGLMRCLVGVLEGQTDSLCSPVLATMVVYNYILFSKNVIKSLLLFSSFYMHDSPNSAVNVLSIPQRQCTFVAVQKLHHRAVLYCQFNSQNK